MELGYYCDMPTIPELKLKTRVGQIFLEHPKDQNYTSIYEETFTKQGRTVELFAVMEVIPSGRNGLNKSECETLSRTIVSAFKKTYIAAPTTDDDTFERALAAINAALGKLGTKGKINWYGQLHAALAAYAGSELCLSTTGGALVYLERGGNFSLLSEGLSEEARAIKIFSNYSAGRLMKKDRIILSTKALFNYLSLDKLREVLHEQSLDEICQEIISSLTDVKNVGFSTFIFETYSGGASASPQLGSRNAATAFTETIKPLGRASGAVPALLGILKIIGVFLRDVLRLIFALILRLIRRKSGPLPRRSLVLVAVIILALLGTSIAFSVWKKSTNDQKTLEETNLRQVEALLNQAEAATIYDDENRVLTLVEEAQKLLQQIKRPENSEKLANLNNLALGLKDKINREIVIDNPTLLTTFPMIPTDLVGSPNGLLAFNRNTSVLAFYDFRSGEVKPLLSSQNTSGLLLGGYVGGDYGYVFFQRNGKFAHLDLTSDALTEYLAETPNLADPDKAKIQDLAVLGSGASARIYLLDTVRNQIWRFRASANQTIGPAEGWLKGETQVQDALDIAIDNNVYVLRENELDRYFNGTKQNFNLGAVSPAVKQAQKVFTAPDQQFIYILDPQNDRVLLYNKNGRLQNQLKSPKFRDASDFFVNEKSKIIYIVAGSDLLQVNY